MTIFLPCGEGLKYCRSTSPFLLCRRSDADGEATGGESALWQVFCPSGQPTNPAFLHLSQVPRAKFTLIRGDDHSGSDSIQDQSGSNKQNRNRIDAATIVVRSWGRRSTEERAENRGRSGLRRRHRRAAAVRAARARKEKRQLWVREVRERDATLDTRRWRWDMSSNRSRVASLYFIHGSKCIAKLNIFCPVKIAVVLITTSYNSHSDR